MPIIELRKNISSYHAMDSTGDEVGARRRGTGEQRDGVDVSTVSVIASDGHQGLPQMQDNLLRSLANMDEGRRGSTSYGATEDHEAAADGLNYQRMNDGKEFFGDKNKNDGRTLGLFAGVLAPVVLSMFSALLFLRMGFVIGQAGIGGTLVMLGLAYIIVVTTVLSVSAISTNGAVEGGGVYFMISRALGPEFGGAIGFMFYLANVFSSALTATGVVESFVGALGSSGTLFGKSDLIPDTRWFRFLYGCCVVVIEVVICLLGASLFAKAALLVLLVTCVSIISVVVTAFFRYNSLDSVLIPHSNTVVYGVNVTDDVFVNYTGLSGEIFEQNWAANFTIDYSTNTQMDFMSVFAVLFTGVTGVMAGANMSGDLKNPSKSIPLGTLSASAISCGIYVLFALILGASVDRFILVNDYSFAEDINFVPAIVWVGTWMLAFFSSMSNLIGGSRVLEALAKDDLFPAKSVNKFCRYKRNGNPMVAVGLTFVAVILVLLIPYFNVIAAISSIFFLLSYTNVNLACIAMEIASAPNWRPRFTIFTWWTATIGMIGCLLMMFLISVAYTAVSVLVMVLLMLGLHFWTGEKNWGSISQALIFHQVRKYLLMLDPRKEHVKFWRPQVLLLVSKFNTPNTMNLIDFVNDMKKGGLYVIGHVKVGEWTKLDTDIVQTEAPAWWDMVKRLKIKAFVELTVAPSIREGLHHLVHLSGLGAMKPNTIVLGFPRIMSQNFEEYEGDNPRVASSISENEFVSVLRDCLRMQKNVCIARSFAFMDKKAALIRRGRPVFIDVWPLDFSKPHAFREYDASCLFMLQLACIVRMTSTWRKKAVLRVYLVNRHIDEDQLMRHQELENLLGMLRIKALIHDVNWDNQLAQLGDERNHEKRMKPDPFNLPENYVKSIKDLVLENSRDAVVTFLQLPKPPGENSNASVERYMKQVHLMSQINAPVVLVSGMHIVTTTTL